MKNVLLLVHDDTGQEARLQAALDITRALNGHLTCVDVVQLPIIADAYGIAAESVLLADEREREAKNKAALETRLKHEDVPWDWTDIIGNIADCVIDAANLADLIILNRRLEGFPVPDMHNIASRVLMHARKPIVAVPDHLKRFETRGRALVAWDGQTSAAATMRACVPLLQLASRVHIFMVRDGSEGNDVEEAAEYLSRHGIHPTIRVINDGLHAPDHLIVEECDAWKADYCVMGAYNHGRLMETFGGVTKRMLKNSKLPLVLGH